MAITTASVLLGFVLSLSLAIVAFRRSALTEGGTLFAMLLGTITFVFGGWPWFAVIVAFFVSSSVLSQYKAPAKAKVNLEFAKAGARDAFQVTANGIIASLLAVAYYFYGFEWLFAAFVGVIATVNGDTWATELGVLYDKRPRSVLTGKRVRVGTSGAVSVPGTLAAVAGALAIGVTALLAAFVNHAWFASAFLDGVVTNGFAAVAFVFFAGLAGTLGVLADSAFGASVQAMYYCPRCRRETERLTHKCGRETRPIKGVAWFDNDTVNLAASLVGGVVAGGAFLLLGL